jgi:hypothetical protein
MMDPSEKEPWKKTGLLVLTENRDNPGYMNTHGSFYLIYEVLKGVFNGYRCLSRV